MSLNRLIMRWTGRKVTPKPKPIYYGLGGYTGMLQYARCFDIHRRSGYVDPFKGASQAPDLQERTLVEQLFEVGFRHEISLAANAQTTDFILGVADGSEDFGQWTIFEYDRRFLHLMFKDDIGLMKFKLMMPDSVKVIEASTASC